MRLAKTRSQAVVAISKGKVKLNRKLVKPSHEISLGDTITIQKNVAVFSYQVTQLLDKRVGAKLVAGYLIDQTPEEERNKYYEYQLSQKIYRENGKGKPTKKERRALEDFLGER